MRLALPCWTHLGGPSALVQDEGHPGAVRAGLACVHVEHGLGGQGPGHRSASCHLPQLLRVPTDGEVVEHLDAGAQDRQSHQPGSQPPTFGVQPDTASEPPYSLPYCYVGETHTRGGRREDKQDVLWRQFRGL